MKIKPLICIICFVLFLAYLGKDPKYQVKYRVHQGNQEVGSVEYTITTHGDKYRVHKGNQEVGSVIYTVTSAN